MLKIGAQVLRRSRFDARGTRRQRCLPQPAVLGSPRILARSVQAATAARAAPPSASKSCVTVNFGT